MNQPEHEHPPIQPVSEPKAKSGGCGKIAIGCGIATLIVLILLGIGGYLLFSNARGLMGTGFATVMNEAVQQSTLPDDQKQALAAKIEEVKEDFIAGDITFEQIGQAMENLDIQNLVAGGFAQYVGARLIESSSLSAEDKARGKQAMNRVAHGALEGQIATSDIEQALTPIMQTNSNGELELKPNPTEDELRQVLDNAEDLADQAGVPQDVAEVDFAKRVQEAFDEALGTTQP